MATDKSKEANKMTDYDNDPRIKYSLIRTRRKNTMEIYKVSIIIGDT